MYWEWRMGTRPKGGKLHRYIYIQCLPTFAFSDNIQFIMKDVGTPTSVSDIETGRSNSTIFAIIYFHLYNWYLQARVSLYKLMCCVLSHSNPIYVDSHRRDKFSQSCFTIHIHTHWHTEYPDPTTTSMPRAALISVVCLSILESAVMFVVGVVCGHCCISQRWRESTADKQSKSSTANEHGEDLELKENVAYVYITIHPKRLILSSECIILL